MTSFSPGEQSFAAEWTGIEDLPPQIANQALVQVGLSAKDGSVDGVYVTLGHSAPPLLYGEPNIMKEQLARLDGRLPVQAVARVFIPDNRLEEIVDVLKMAVEATKAQASAGSAESTEAPAEGAEVPNA